MREIFNDTSHKFITSSGQTLEGILFRCIRRTDSVRPTRYERLILDAMRGDHTLFTTAEGIERLWEVATPLLEAPPPVRFYAQGSWGPNAIHQLVAPHAWRLPFERAWRDPNPIGS